MLVSGLIWAVGAIAHILKSERRLLTRLVEYPSGSLQTYEATSGI